MTNLLFNIYVKVVLHLTNNENTCTAHKNKWMHLQVIGTPHTYEKIHLNFKYAKLQSLKYHLLVC